jgi:hypothetical protein
MVVTLVTAELDMIQPVEREMVAYEERQGGPVDIKYLKAIAQMGMMWVEPYDGCEGLDACGGTNSLRERRRLGSSS